MVWSRKRTSSQSRNNWSHHGKDSAPGAVLPRISGDGDADAHADLRSRRINHEHPAWDGEGFAGGVITRVALQQRTGAERLNVFLDGEYAFSVAAVVGSHLREQFHLEATDIDELIRRDDAERANDRSLSFLANRPRSKTEVRRRLREAGLPPQAIETALERLDRGGLVNDEEFAAYWVSQRTSFHPRGPRALRAELRAKGVDAETVASALEPTADGQLEAACRAVEKKAQRLPLVDERAFTQNIVGFLVRRGFDYGVARVAARQTWQERTAPGDDLG